jgi:hypothetical protein
VCPLGRFTGFTSHLKGTSCNVKFGAGKPQAFSTSMSLFVGVPQLLADGVQLTRYRRKLSTDAHTSRGDPGAARGSKCGDSLDRFGQQLFATGLLLRQRREATLLWTEGAENLLDTGPIVDCLFHLGFRSCAASLVARGAGELLNECAALLCLEAQRLVDGTLTNEEESVLGEARPVEQLVEVSKANLLAIEQVLLAATAIGATGNLNFGERKVKEPILIGDRERNLGEAERTTLL